jgi:hypothetical protein
MNTQQHASDYANKALGNSVSPSVPTRSDAGPRLGAELDQRLSEAKAQCEYHSGEATAWSAVARACVAGLKTLNEPQQQSSPAEY